MSTGLLTTTLGNAAIAGDLAGGADLVLTHVAWGDANGVPYSPNPSQLALVNERYRATIASVAAVAGAIVVDAVIPADTNDGLGRPSHGFNVAEVGLFNAAGTLIGVARLGNGYKAPPSSGQAENATYRLKLAVANPSAISVVIDPLAQVQIGRNVRPFWMTVDGIQNAPPGAPAIGATYVIGAAPTGAWTGFAHRLAQWIGVWALASAPEGHIVGDRSKAESDAARFLKRTADGWDSANASTTAFGFSRLATPAETAAGTAGLSVSPDNLGGVLANLPIHAEVKTSDGRFTFTAAGGNVVVTGATIMWRGFRDFDLTTLSLGNRTFGTVANKIYHLRWYAPGIGRATPAAAWPTGRLFLEDTTDAGYNPSALGEAATAFDTTYDNLLIARVVTDASNAATIIPLANKAFLRAFVQSYFDQATPGAFSVNGSFFFSCLHALAWNWGRVPDITGTYGEIILGSAAGTFYLNGAANIIRTLISNRYGAQITVGGDWLEPAPTPLYTYTSLLQMQLGA